MIINIIMLKHILNLKYTTPFRKLLPVYPFVNIPVQSKYYHEQLPIHINKAIQLVIKESALNEKCYLLEHIVDLVQKDPKLFYTQTNKHIIIEELRKWRGGKGRFQKVATVAWIIKKLKLQRTCKDLYQQIIQRIDNDEWYVNFDESVKAMQAFTDYHDTQVRDRVYEKIQRNVNMVYYQRITTSLLQAGRFQSLLWEKIQNHVIKNLGMDYSFKTFCEIFKAYAISHNGSNEFYEIGQQVLYKGHYHNQTYRIKNNLSQFSADGQYFALLVQTYGIVKHNTNIQILPQFMQYIFKSLQKVSLKYKQIQTLTTLITYLPKLQFQRSQQQILINHIVQKKKFTNFNTIQEIQKLYSKLQQFYGHIPQKIQHNVQQLIVYEVERKLLPIIKAVQLTQFMINNNTTQTKYDLLQHTQNYINSNYQYLEPYDAKALILYLNTTPKLPQNSNEKEVRLMLPSSLKR